MMRAAQARGQDIWICAQSALHWSKSRVASAARRISLADDDADWYRPHDTATRELRAFDAVLMRKDPPFDMEYVASTWLLSAAAGGAGVFWTW